MKFARFIGTNLLALSLLLASGLALAKTDKPNIL